MTTTDASSGTSTGTRPVDFGPGRRTIRTARDRLSGVVNVRAVTVAAVCLLGCVAIFFVALATGDYPIDLATLFDVVRGRETGFPAMVVLEWRLPRAVGAVVFGIALGISGALLQSVTRNPLGSPDVIGFNAGAFTGALIAINWLGGSLGTTAALALAGGLTAAAAVYLLAYRRGVSGFRFVVVGVAVSSALIAVNTLLLLRMSTVMATVASIWGQGTLENLRWEQLTPMTAAILPAVVAAVWLAHGMRQLELGDDLARGTGVTAERLRLGLLLLSVVLTAIVTSVCGPIAFVALAAPHIARLATGSAGTPILGAAAVGALLLSGSDFVASRLLPVSVPVGVVTVIVGGIYLVWLITREARRL